MPNPLQLFLIDLNDDLQKQAAEAMMFPKKDQFDHGVQVGQWQGIKRAIQLAESILEDEESR